MKAQLPTANPIVQNRAGRWEHAVPTGTVAFYGRCFCSKRREVQNEPCTWPPPQWGDGGRAAHPGFSATARG